MKKKTRTSKKQKPMTPDNASDLSQVGSLNGVDQSVRLNAPEIKVRGNKMC